MDMLVQNLITDLAVSRSEFLAGSATRRSVYELGCQLADCFRELDPAVPICLGAQGRDSIAASIIAAVATERVLALPHAFSARALRQMQDETGFTSAVVDVDRELSFGVKQIRICELDGKITDSLLGCSPRPDAEVMRIFTGGSTGSAKIWSKSMENIFSEAWFLVSRFNIHEQDIVLATVTPYHIYGLLFSVLVPLLAGARVVDDTPAFPAEIEVATDKYKVTLLASVPAHYRAMGERTLCSSLRLAFSSAGMLPLENNTTFTAKNGVDVVEVYGSTETGGLASRNIRAGERNFTPLGPVAWKIMDERLYVRSPFISIDVPVDDERYFLSGDRVRLEGPDSFSLHGRADAITKVGGERVDLDEVRELLQNQRGVDECVVVSLPENGGRGNRVAALVRSGSGNADLAAIKLVMSVTLEPAAIPKIIRCVSQIPVTANGKYDLNAIASLLS